MHKAVSKSELMTLASAQGQEEVQRMIPLINERLRRGVSPGHSAVHIDFSRNQPEDWLLRKLKTVYEAEGWSVRIGYGDQREPGCWLIFS